MSRAIKAFQKIVKPQNLAIPKVAIDFGSYEVLSLSQGQSHALRTPPMIAHHIETNSLVAIGHEAKVFESKSSSSYSVSHCLKAHQMTDISTMEEFLKRILEQYKDTYSQSGVSFLNPMLFISVDPNTSEVQLRALQKLTRRLPILKNTFVSRPMLAFQGIRHLTPANEHVLYIDCGHQQTTFSLLHFGKVTKYRQIPMGGENITHKIIRVLRKEHQVEIGIDTAEKTKHSLCQRNDKIVVVRGRDILTGSPKSVKLDIKDTDPTFTEFAELLIQEIIHFLEDLEPDTNAQLIQQGFVLGGGSAHCEVVLQTIEKKLGTLLHRIPEPEKVYEEAFRQLFQSNQLDQEPYAWRAFV